MIALGAFVAGAACSALLWRLLGDEWRSSPTLQRENYRGHALPVAAGAIVVLAVALAASAYWTVARSGGITAAESARGATVLPAALAALGFGFIGLLDDLVGTTATKGFRGHLGALASGRVTTGLVKLVAGGVLAVLLALDEGGLVELIRGALLVALAANLANLFDRAPGRVVKVALLGAVVIAVAGAPGWVLTGPMLVLGAGAGMLVPDLRERCMLGDTGANVLGAALGYGLALALGATAQWIAVVVLLALNGASERVSFSRIIDATPPLRWLDRLGARPERRMSGP